MPKISPNRIGAVSFILLAIYLVMPPLGFTVYSAFRVPPDRLPFEDGVTWGFDNILSLYENGLFQNTIVDTLIYTLGAVIFGLLLAVPIAWLIERTDLPLKNIAYTLVLFPLMMPPVVTTMSWLLLLGERTGLLNVIFRMIFPFVELGPFDIFTMYGMIVVQGLSLVPLMFIFISSSMKNLDPTFEEASQVSGASFFTTIRRITLPMLTPSLLGVVILASIFTLESFEVPLVLGGGVQADIFSSHIYFALNDASGSAPSYGLVAALGVHFLVITYALILLYHRILGRNDEQYATIHGKGFGKKLLFLGSWKWPLTVVLGLFLIGMSVAPFLVLLWMSFFPSYVEPSISAISKISLQQYVSLFQDSRFASAWFNTLIVAFLSPSIAVGVTIVLAWMNVRLQRFSSIRLIIDLFISSSLAIPAVVAANALLLFYLLINRAMPSWFPLIGTVVILVLVYSYRIALAYRVNRSAILQIAPELEQASYISGGSSAQTVMKVVIPLIAPSIVAVWMFLFLVSFRDLTLPLVIGRESPPFVVSVLIWKMWGQNPGQAAALGVLTVGFLSGFVLAARIVFRKLIRWN